MSLMPYSRTGKVTNVRKFGRDEDYGPDRTEYIDMQDDEVSVLKNLKSHKIDVRDLVDKADVVNDTAIEPKL